MDENYENKTPGYILLHRKILDKPYFTDSAYVHLWIYILLKTNHADKMHDGVLIKRGSFKTGRKKIAKDTWINESKVDRMLKFLESEQEIEQQKTNKYRIITVVNWDKFQKVNSKVNNTAQQKSAEQQQKTQLSNYSNDINESNYNTKDIEDIKNIWNEFAEHNDLSKIISLSKKRVAAIKKRSTEGDFNLQKILDIIESSDFLLGKNKNGWKVDFDFVFCSTDNYLKILEGKYKNKGAKNGKKYGIV